MIIKAKIGFHKSMLDQAPINGDDPIHFAKECLIERICLEISSELKKNKDWMILNSSFVNGNEDDGNEYSIILSLFNEKEMKKIQNKMNIR
jgi:hypothetical protein